MADRFVMHDGQLCRVSESFEAVDVAQLEATVAQHEQVVAQHKDEHAGLQAQLDAKALELEDAESVLEDSKRNHQAAKALVDDGTDAAQADGASGAVTHLTPEQIF